MSLILFNCSIISHHKSIPHFTYPFPHCYNFEVFLTVFSVTLHCIYLYMCPHEPGTMFLLTIFSSRIASCRVQIFSVSLTTDLARYFCLPPSPLSTQPLPGKLNLGTTSGPFSCWWCVSHSVPWQETWGESEAQVFPHLALLPARWDLCPSAE